MPVWRRSHLFPLLEVIGTNGLLLRARLFKLQESFPQDIMLQILKSSKQLVPTTSLVFIRLEQTSTAGC